MLNRVTKATPFSLLFNIRPRSVTGDEVGDAVAQESDATVLKRREKAGENVRQHQEKQREHYNKKRGAAPSYKPGDMVMLEREPGATGESRKLRPKYRGPYIVVKKLLHDSSGSPGDTTVATFLRRYCRCRPDEALHGRRRE
ncbi:unnamed protein product [Ixodes hexagonus]